jgi:DNA helicase-2/ATP-dependent DNA helicase PcrA
MRDFESELNERQAEAVRTVRGPLLVIAGAGSGKTRVITYRIANLVANHDVPTRRIMAVTFTNKAAGEMRRRVESLLQSGADCWVATFHASCAKLLRRYGERFGVDPRFTIYDDQDQKAMIARVLKELDLGEKQFPPRALQHEINRAKRELVGPDDYPEGDFYRARVKQVYALYERRMRDASALDFGDLLYRIVVGMRADDDLAAEIAGIHDYVHVDEFQDTNRVQLELVRLLAKPHGNICVVGDDDQSIYSWRGADVGNILEFERFFPGARTVTLDRNYRSTGNVLKAAHGVVSRLVGRRPKELWTSNEEGEKIGVIEAPDEREEARLVARAVRELAADGFPLREQAVFYRTNAQSRVFEEVFRTLNIPHRVVGGMRFYERAEVKDVIAYLRLVQNPADHAAFVRVVNTPPRGIGKTTLDRLTAVAAGHGISLHEAIAHPAAADLGTAAVARLAAFCAMVDAWRAEIAEGPSRLARRIVAETEYVARLESENNAEADARMENVQELLGSIEDFENDAETPTLASFLELVALQTDVDAARFDGEEATLMTVHAAKGLEFDVVFVTGLEEGLFPFRRGDDALGLYGDGEAAMDEERRLGYVAMTRARKRLFLTRAADRRLFGGSRSNPPSRFFAEVPREITVDLSPRRPEVAFYAGSARPSRPAFGAARPAAPRRTAVWVDKSLDQSREGAPVAPGLTVRHSRFGVGTVVAVHPGAKIKVDVQFPAFGRKTILLDYLELD